MFPLGFPLPRIFPTAHCDASVPAPAPAPSGGAAAALKETVKSAVAMKETELARWRRTFEANAKEINGQK
jgi:solute carrier family 25 aspartate/glutamate transporter 12/13